MPMKMNFNIRSSALTFAVVACVLANFLSSASATQSSDLNREMESSLQMYYDEATKSDSPSGRNVKRSVLAENVGLDEEVGSNSGVSSPTDNHRLKRAEGDIRRAACDKLPKVQAAACKALLIKKVKRSVLAENVGLDEEVGSNSGVSSPTDNIHRLKRAEGDIRRAACDKLPKVQAAACKALLIKHVG